MPPFPCGPDSFLDHPLTVYRPLPGSRRGDRLVIVDVFFLVLVLVHLERGPALGIPRLLVDSLRSLVEGDIILINSEAREIRRDDRRADIDDHVVGVM